MEESFVHLHVHSHYSMMWGVSSVKVLCETAAEAGFRTLALTDTNGFYGLIHFLEAARQAGIHPIVGAALETQNPTEAAVILARTLRGYECLSRMITDRNRGDFSLLRDFPEVPEDLTVLSSHAETLQALRSRVPCRVEIIPGPADRKALHMAHELGLPPVATNAVYFAHPEDHALHRLVRAIDCNETLSTLPPQEVVPPDRWLKPAPLMAGQFPHSSEAVNNTVKLARQCHATWDHFRTVFPHYEDRREDHFTLLQQKCREGIAWRYDQTSAAVEKRLEEELELIRVKGFVDYFLVVNDLVHRRPIHCGRGSAAASLVSYLLGITHVDPIRHNLLFGRFLNPHRQDPPDIDVDFPWDERDGLLEEVRNSYGHDRQAMVSNHVGFGGRAAIREVAKVYGIPAADIKEVTRRMSFGAHPGRIRHRVETHPRFQGFPLDPPWPDIMRWAERLEALPRHLSVHCGGIILTPDHVSRYVPVQRSAKGAWIIQWEKEQAEQAGLVKIDLLGNRSLAVIRDTLAAVGQNTGMRIDYASLNPLDDPATVDLLRRGDSMGVFYVESPAMRQLQKKTQRGDFEHLVIHSSIIRPAANRYIQEYVRRLHGAPYEPLHPSLGKLLAETYGILVYQEDVVRVSMVLAGFDWAEADGLRKVISKKSSEKLSQYRRSFYDGCAGRGVSREVTDRVWEMFLSFAGYSFCKPHSASYALVSFKSAYLKAHHPAEFMAAVLSNGGGYYTARAYISEAQRMGLRVLGPDVNESDWNYTGKDQTVRLGLQQIQNIRKETLENLLKERKTRGAFTSLEDFLERVDLSPGDGAVLVKSGALDSLADGLNRPQILWSVAAALNHPSTKREKRIPTQKSLFHRSRRGISPPLLPPLTPRQHWRQEAEALGFSLSAHPLKLWEPFLPPLPSSIIAASRLSQCVGRKVWVLGWPVTRKEVLTREGESMEFISFEDTTAIYETVFFPRAFQRFCQDVDMNRAYLLYGRVESEFGAESLNVLQMKKISNQNGQSGVDEGIQNLAPPTPAGFVKIRGR